MTIIYGNRFSYTTRVVGSFIGQAIFMAIVPFTANLGGDTGFYACFVTLLFFGVFSGIC